MRLKFRFVAVLLTVICLCTALLPVPAFAGTSKTTIDSSTFAEKINNAVWNNPNGDVTVQEGKLVFPGSGTADTRLISKTAVSKNDVTEMMFQAKYDLNILDIPEGETFILAFGLRSIESFSGEKGNVELGLTNQGGVKASLTVYESADAPTVLVEPQIADSNTISVEITLTQDQQLTVKVNNAELYSGELAVSGEGRFGFLQTGGCSIEISDLRIAAYSYDRPENVNVSESFDDGTMDTSKLSSKMIKDFGYFPCRISVDEYNGDDVMLFKNSGLGYIGTKYPYSNFELTFDIPYLQRSEVYSEDYELLTPRSSWFGVSFGDEYAEATWYDYDYKSPYMIYFDENSNILDFKLGSKVLASLGDSEHAFFAPGEERGFSVKFSVIDAHVTIGIKWLEEDTYTTVCEYDIWNGQTPTGYIHIWGSEPNNMAIDNVVIVNKDINPILIETEYKAGTVVVPADYTFTRAEKVFKEVDEPADQTESEDEAEQGFNWMLLIPCAGVVSLLMVAACILSVRHRKRKEVA